MALRNSWIGNGFSRLTEKAILPVAQRYLHSPNQFTLLGLWLAVMVPVGFYLHPAAGFVCLLFSGLADIMDGMVARARNMKTVYGAFLDSSVDRFADFLYLLGFWILFWPNRHFLLASIFIYLSFLSCFMISYLKARAEGLGGTCDVGLMERAARTLYLILWALALALFPRSMDLLLWPGLILFWLLTAWTVAQRLAYIKRHLPA